MLKKVLITGISGFAGSYLVQNLIKNKNYSLNGTYLLENSLENIGEIKDEINLVKVDLINAKKVSDLVSHIKPDLIYHLAALTSPALSFTNPSEVITNNITVQINLLEAVKNAGLENCRILIVSSGDIYGAVEKENLPISENVEFRPTSPYSVSKIAQDFLGLQYFLSYGLKIIRVRPFNHVGPRQSPNFVVSSFAKKIAEIEKGKLKPILRVGNLEVKRDFTDVRDMVYAYTLVLEKGSLGDVYNIGSGISYKISEILNKLLSFSKIKIKVELDPSLLRPLDILELVCDNRKFKKLTGWQPKIPIETTLAETLAYWRNII